MIKEIAILSPIFITLFWSIVFLIQLNKKDDAKIQLGIFMAVAFVLYFTHAIFFNNLHNLYSYLECIYIFTSLSVYPLYYNYLQVISSNKIELKFRIIHLLPALLLSCVALILTLFLSAEQRVMYVQEILMNKNLKEISLANLIQIKGVIFFISRIIFIFQAGYYMVRGILIAQKHNKRILDYFSNTEGKTMNWVFKLHIVLLIVSVSSITFAFIGRSYFLEHEVSLIIPSAIFSVFLFLIGFNGNSQIYLNPEVLNEEEPKNSTEETEDRLLKNQLELLFVNKEVYKNSDLRITMVANALKTNRTYVSKLINDEFHMNFNEYVNKYRIEEAKKLLLDKNRHKFTLEYIAEQSGFGSVNSFTRVFKSFEGFSPGKYKGVKNN